jgi:hypothetical protein
MIYGLTEMRHLLQSEKTGALFGETTKGEDGRLLDYLLGRPQKGPLIS